MRRGRLPSSRLSTLPSDQPMTTAREPITVVPETDMHLPASRLAALALSAVVLLMAGAPSASAKKGSHGHQRREPGVLRAEKKDSPGHHRGHDKPNRGSGHGHGHERTSGKTKH